MFVAAGVSIALNEDVVVSDVSLALQRGEVVGLIGPNGAGKSSLLRGAIGLLPARSGAVSIDDHSWTSLDLSERARKVAYLAQDPVVHWPLSVESVVALGRLPHERETAGERRQVLDKIFDEAEISHLRERTMFELSGGERARVLIARSFAVDADYLFADEPIAGLDPFHQLQFMELFRDQANSGKGLLLVLHDLSLAARYCDRLLLMAEGSLQAEGSPAEVLTKDRLAAVFQIEAVGDIEGTPPILVPSKRL
ncbi:MAG: ATP-binding cassette domain-containing protein [Pseudomonadales bacterium]|nr:ATP-binding cassette domain-containing protein [Pseudomonadales bacterium]